MFDYSSLFPLMQDTPLQKWSESLAQQLEQILADGHGDLERWQSSLQKLPQIQSSKINFNADNLQIITQEPVDLQQLEVTLKEFQPWRKGPYQINDCLIDTEWHSDWKWNRIKDHLSPLKNRYVLDIGCGNGYHCWRMYGAGARLVIGIDPSRLFLMQFMAIKHFVDTQSIHPVYLLPMV